MFLGLVSQTSLFAGRIDFSTDTGIDAGACQFLQNIRFLTFLTLEKFGKISLSEQSGAAELFKAQSYGFLYFSFDFCYFGKLDTGLSVFQGPFDTLQ